jgi:methionine biosynthesis protein MetW
MLRISARRCIVSFPNFGFWKVRAKLLLLRPGAGHAEPALRLVHDSPNRHVLSIDDFRQFCASHGTSTSRSEIPLSRRGIGWSAWLWPNLLADEAVFVISNGNGAKEGNDPKPE